MQANELSPLPRVLVVDDSRIVRATIKKHLAGAYDVIEEADGEAGWARLLADESVCLMISDLTMPELDGMGLLARVRQAPEARFRLLPIIIVSGEEDEETRQNCVTAGASDFVTKSTDRAEMLARVAANIELARTHRELDAVREAQSRTSTHVAEGVGSNHLLKLQIEQSLSYARRHRSEVTVLLIEIDDFSGVQAHLGERVASQMLQLLGKQLSGKLRNEDTLAQVAGPQFAVVSAATTLAESRILGERLRQAIANARINFRGEQLQVTASIAVANSLHDDADDTDALLAAAGERLRAEIGSNRVLVPEPSPTHVPTPAIAEALALLHKGDAAEIAALTPHLPALLANLAPLLELANRELDLGWSMERFSL